MTVQVTVRHNFESAHRLFHLGGKCQNLHGHSWWAEITVAGPLTDQEIVVDFGRLKKAVRGWIDEYFDHGALIGFMDPLLPALLEDGTKTFVFGLPDAEERPWHQFASDLSWPTVEGVAVLLQRVVAELLVDMGLDKVRVVGVKVTETHVNAAGVTA